MEHKSGKKECEKNHDRDKRGEKSTEEDSEEEDTSHSSDKDTENKNDSDEQESSHDQNQRKPYGQRKSRYDLNNYVLDNGLSHNEFFVRMKQGELQLQKELEAWKEQYKLDEEVDPETTEQQVRDIITGSYDGIQDGLTEEELKTVKAKRKELDSLSLEELLEYVSLCTFS